MGISIIHGFQNSLQAQNHSSRSDNITNFHFLACVRQPESAVRLRKTFARDGDMITVVENDNAVAASKADAIILACKPDALHQVLRVPDIAEAIKGKLLISILAGITEIQIRSALGQNDHDHSAEIICAIPNVASTVSRSTTVVALPHSTSVSLKIQRVASELLRALGWVVQVPPEHVNISTVLCASGPAYVSLVLEALADAAIAHGVTRSDALEMAACTIQGTAQLVIQGESPASIRKRVCTPGGCSAQGLKLLEKADVANTFIEALREAEQAIEKLSLFHRL